MEMNMIKNQLNNCLFSININNNIYGYFMKGINNENDVYININKSWDYLKENIKNDSFDILLLNDNKITIDLNNIKRYFNFLKEDYTILLMDKNDIPNYMNNINDIELDEEILNKQLIEYNNDFIIIP